jgi:hypothetical protein
MVEILLLIALVAAVVFYLQRRKAIANANFEHARANTALSRLNETEKILQETKEKMESEASANAARLQEEIDSLSRFKDIRDIAATTEQLRRASATLKDDAERSAQLIRDRASLEAEEIRKQANLDAKTKREKIEDLLNHANQQAAHIINEANERAEQIAGDAFRALKEADQLRETATAMRNVIEGYGDRYLKPTYSLLDELADAYGFDEAGQELKKARERSKLFVETGRAADCEYVEANRKETAIRFVIDAFNGKVDSILSRTKAENYGTLERQIQDAFALVNNNGRAFRNARVTAEYLMSRLAELRWATATQALRDKDREEQRAIRERIREEERARKEIERALKDAAKEEESLQKAMQKVQAQVAKANDDQRAAFEAQLADLQSKLAEAEARNQRALSMAQQTRAGHVYIISNIGSFGESVFKVGMTRRLEPLDRVRELGDASVPFAFDVHAMIWSEDAPSLERELHKHFVRAQVNKVNPRKEFFRIELAELRKAIEEQGVEASWTMSAAALEYRESLAIEQRLKDNPSLAVDWLRSQESFVPEVEVETAES